MNRFTVQVYDQAMRNMRQILGGVFSVDTAEQPNGDWGADACEFMADLPTPAPASEATLLAASAGCKRVPLLKEDTAKVAALKTAKRNPAKRPSIRIRILPEVWR